METLKYQPCNDMIWVYNFANSARVNWDFPVVVLSAAPKHPVSTASTNICLQRTYSMFRGFDRWRGNKSKLSGGKYAIYVKHALAGNFLE